MHVQVVNFGLVGVDEAGYVALCDELAPAFAAAPGLLTKVWLADSAAGVYGGARGACVLALDGGGIEPSAGGFVRALGAAVGLDDALTDEPVLLVERLGALDTTVVIVVDVYERLRRLDTWLRQEFVPKLPARCRVVIAGREPPLLGWHVALDGAGAFAPLALAGLTEAEATELVVSSGLSAEHARAVARLTRGHPLAVQLAAEVVRSGVIDDVVAGRATGSCKIWRLPTSATSRPTPGRRSKPQASCGV